MLSAPETTGTAASAAPRPGPGVLVGVLVAAATGALTLVGTGLHPVWWVTWFAPVPVLWLAPRVRARRAAWTAALAATVGMAGYARYLVAVLDAPPGMAAGVVAVAVVVLTGTVLLFRALTVRGRPASATLAAAAAWTSGEYLTAVLTPSGTNWTLADSQADDLPVLQVVAVLGPWGVGAVMTVVACAVAAAATPGPSVRARAGVAATGLAVLAAAVVPGLVALAAPAPARSTAVSAVAAARGPGQPRADSRAGRDLVDADLRWIAGSAPRGGLVVFPEKDLVVDDATLPGLVGRFAPAATARAATVVLGVETHRASTVTNDALVFLPGRTEPLVYHKRYPVPGVEEEVTPGDAPLTVPGAGPPTGVAICADLGQASLGREYGRAGVGVLAAPALDFVADAWSQSRVQFLRGVENGYPVVRASRQGVLTVSDARGRVLAEAVADDRRTTAVSVPVGIAASGTPYSRRGDWFAWLCLAGAGAGVVAGTRPRS